MTHANPFALALRGTHLIEASAGTGKTHAITAIYLRAVVEQGLVPSQLLVVTFTRAATAELKERILLLLRSAHRALVDDTGDGDLAVQAYLSRLSNRPLAAQRVRQALEGIDEAAIYTIHGFCQRILEQHAFESQTRFDIELLESLDDLREEVLNDVLISELRQAFPSVVRRFTTQAGAERAAQLVHSFHTRPNLRILPEASTARPLATALEQFRQAQEQARRAFDPGSISRKLSTHSALNRNKVSIRHLSAKLAQAARLLEPTADVERWPERFVLQYSTLLHCLRKGHTEPPEHAFFHACDTLADAHRNLGSLLEEQQFALELRCARAALTLESSRKALLAVQGFDDLLFSVLEALLSPLGQELARGLRERYPLALIDEFQDTDPIQTSIFFRIYADTDACKTGNTQTSLPYADVRGGASRASLFLVGDPKQSIYSFRGADVHAYLAAASVPNLGHHSLEINWRSDPGLIGALNALYSQQGTPFLYSEIEYRPVTPRSDARDRFDDAGQALSGVTVAFIDPVESPTIMDQAQARRRCAEHAALHVQDLLSRRAQGRTHSPKDVAILTRTNAEATLVQEALRALDLKSALATDTSVFSTESAVQLTLLLRALVYPHDSSAIASALLTRGFDCQPRQLATIFEDFALWDDKVEKFEVAHDLLMRRGIFAAVQNIFDAYDVIPHLLQGQSGERLVTNLYHLLEIAELQRVKKNLSPVALLRWMQKMQQDPSEVAHEARQLRIESDDDSVMITTIHRSKGLEYPFVFCPFLWADSNRPPRSDELVVYHDDTAGNWVVDLRGKDAAPEALAAARREREAESLRLIYVALTRAVHGVTLFVPPVKGLENTALGRFLGGAARETKPGKLSPPELRRRLQAVQSVEGARLHLIDAISTQRAADVCAPSQTPPLTLNPLSRRVASSWVASSFSALVAGLSAHSLSTTDEQGKDVDAEPALGLRSFENSSAPARFSALPAGAASGDTLHRILECIDFASFDPATDRIVEPQLARLGSIAPADAARTKQDLMAVLQAPLLAVNPALRLQSVELRRRRSELQFSLGVGFDAQGRVQNHISARALAEVLTPAVTGLDQSYAASVAQLRFAPLAGYLRGFIDLVFEHAGKTYVVDYKSTSISDTIAGFTPALIERVVASHHYALQAALYSLVIHRYLRWRKRAYDYERDFGGALIVFLRGVCPTQPPGHAVYFHRAPSTAIDALDSLFCTAGAA